MKRSAELSTAGSRGAPKKSSVLNDSPLRGDQRAAWERAIIEDELSRPLEVDSGFIRQLANKEADTEARLLAELRVHATALDNLRNKLLQREAAAERAYTIKIAKDGVRRFSPGPSGTPAVGQRSASPGGLGAAQSSSSSASSDLLGSPSPAKRAGAGPGSVAGIQLGDRSTTLAERAFQTFTATEAHVLTSLEKLQALEGRISELEAKASGAGIAEALGLQPISAGAGGKLAGDSKVESTYGGAPASRSASRPMPGAGFAPALGLVYTRRKVPGLDGSPSRVVYSVESIEKVAARAELAASLGGGLPFLPGADGTRRSTAAEATPAKVGGSRADARQGPYAQPMRMTRSVGPAIGRGLSSGPPARGRSDARTSGGAAAGRGGTKPMQRAQTVAIGNDIARRVAAERARQAAKAPPSRPLAPGAVRTERQGARAATSKAAMGSFQDLRKKFEASKGQVSAVTGGANSRTNGRAAVAPSTSSRGVSVPRAASYPAKGKGSAPVAAAQGVGAARVTGQAAAGAPQQRAASNPRKPAPLAAPTRSSGAGVAAAPTAGGPVPSSSSLRRPAAGAPAPALAVGPRAVGASAGTASLSKTAPSAGTGRGAGGPAPLPGRGLQGAANKPASSTARSQFGASGVKLVTGAAALQQGGGIGGSTGPAVVAGGQPARPAAGGGAGGGGTTAAVAKTGGQARASSVGKGKPAPPAKR